MDKLEYISKSAFALAMECRTKLFYYKNGFPQIMPSIGAQLKDDGYKIGKLAQIIYGPGTSIDISLGIDSAVEETAKLLNSNTNITIFEAAFLVDNKLAIVDVLQKEGELIKIKEVKSKSIKGTTKNKNGSIKSDWTKYYNDIAFQYIAVKKYFETKSIKYDLKPYLVLVDNSKTVNIDGLSFMFEIVKDFDVDETSNFNTSVNFIGNEDDVKKNNILVVLDVYDDIQPLIPVIEKQTIEFVNDLVQMKQGNKFITKINVHCKKCEFKDEKMSGLKECWGTPGLTKPHLFDLYQGTQITVNKNNYFDLLINEKKFTLLDIDQSILTSAYSGRQKIQINYTKDNKSWYSNELKKIILTELKYPLYFIDFEATRSRIPPYKDMKPNQTIAYQWSCHKVNDPNSKPIHSEYINLIDNFPNFDFAKSLMNTVNTPGTLFMWHNYETTILKEILTQLTEFNANEPELEEWLNEFSQKDKFVDMRLLTAYYYFHPDMEGSNSLKDVLPAIWKNYTSINQDVWFKEYYEKVGENILNPYQTLKAENIIDKAEVICEGAGAIIGYQKLIESVRKNDMTGVTNWKDLLLQYCKLDTMAMVIVWKHWLNLANNAAITNEEVQISD